MLYRIYNRGEVPALAHGWRPVTTLEAARPAADAWRRLGPVPDRGSDPRKVRAVIRRRLRYAARTRAVAAALRRLEAPGSGRAAGVDSPRRRRRPARRPSTTHHRKETLP